MTLRTLLLGAAPAFALSVPVDAQTSFDVIHRDHVRLDFNEFQGVSMSSAILVNTGTTSLDLDEYWGDGLHFGELSAPVGRLLMSVKGQGIVLQPGEAVGPNSPELTALLLPSETLVSGALTLNIQIDRPVPMETSQQLRLAVHASDRLFVSDMLVEFVDLPGNQKTELVSARRVTPVIAPHPVQRMPSGCAGNLNPWGLEPSLPSYDVADSSDLPYIGNSNFHLRIGALPLLKPFILAIDVAPGNFTAFGCGLHLGLTPAMISLPGFAHDVTVYRYLPIPDNPGIVGGTLYAQVLVLDDIPFLTRSLRFTIGSLP